LKRSFDIVLVDLEMPVMDGFELVRRMRAHEKLSRIPIVILTVHDGMASIVRAYHAGATSFTTKPINWCQLSYHLRYVLRASRAEAQAREAQARMAELQRMEAIGKITGGVAHDFNNLLMVIGGAAERLTRVIPGGNSDVFVGMIATAVKRGKTLTNHLLSFARRQTLEAMVIDVAEMLPNVSEMLKRSLRGDIEIGISTPDAACHARVDPGELELALLNLGVNARDAMPEGGTISLAVRKTRLSGEARTDGLRGEFVAIELRDSGAGIPPDVLPHVFDPFFTTKVAGTGLGLSQVYGFAKQSGGAVVIDSKVGHGTTVNIFLPWTEDPVEAGQRPVVVEDQSRTDNGKVLLVEDDQAVADISSEYLEQLGFTVDRVSNGSDALRTLQKECAYDLVFSDILMPGGVTGLELARAVQQNHPNIPILLTTGYSQKAQQAASEGFAILPKPYDLQGLSEAISELRSKPAIPTGLCIQA
jgi:two-component system NtrC family sensor kinase